jgi:diguanylate cyclase (GGDEF)-like protein
VAEKDPAIARPVAGALRRLFTAVLRSWERVPRGIVVAVSLLVVGVNFLASYFARDDLRFSFFYMVPIALSAWFVGRLAGILFSLLCAGAWVVEAGLEKHLPSQEWPVGFWNAVLLLGFYLALSTILSALREALQRETSAARLDPLTRIANRRSFFELAEAEIRRVARYGGQFTVAYMDLDNFKVVNDRDGHETGDRVLVLAAEAMRGSLRASDVVARLGGDEFIVLLPQTGAVEADAVFRKLEGRLAAVMRQGDWPVTVSVGAATFEKPPRSVEEMVGLVDELMYAAKMSGKNRLEKRVVGE